MQTFPVQQSAAFDGFLPPLCVCSGSGPSHFPLGEVQLTVRHSSQRNKIIVVVHACRYESVRRSGFSQKYTLYQVSVFTPRWYLSPQKPDSVHWAGIRSLRPTLPASWQTAVGQEENSHIQEDAQPSLWSDVSVVLLTVNTFNQLLVKRGLSVTV